MTVLLADGFEGVNTAQAKDVWAENASGALAVGATGRRGSNGATITRAGGVATITRTFTASTTVRVELALKIGAITAGVLVAFLDGGSFQVELRIGADGLLLVSRNAVTLATATNTPLTAGHFYHIGFEVTINNTTGSFEVRVNGVAVGNLTQSSQDTQNTANATANQLYIASQGAGFLVVADDIVVTNDQGSAPHNDWLGDCRIDYLAPNGAGNYTQWTPSAGSNYQNVDENPGDDDTTYNSETTVNEIDTYTLTDLGGSNTVFAVVHMHRSRKDDAGSASVRPKFRRAAVDGNGAAVALGDTYLTYHEIFQVDPTDSSAWTAAKVDALEVGIERTA